MVDYLKRSWAVVDIDNIASNVTEIKKMLSPSCMIMGVIKADAYGHGDKFVADALVKLGVNWFGVSNIDEALSLRSQGIFHPILIFGSTPPEHAKLLSKYNLTQTIYSTQYANSLHTAALAAGVRLNVHIKIDTGMSRLGFAMDDGFLRETEYELAEICLLPAFNTQGIYTHFSCADEGERDSINFTEKQFASFMDTVDWLRNNGIKFAIHHCCNSAATLCYPHMHLDMVRPGIALYGLSPSKHCKDKLDLHPAMQLYSSISMVKEIPADTAVSYGRCYISNRKTKVATVSIGYADGYERDLSGKAKMLVRGQFANVIGRVCMDQLMLDVTHIKGVCAGDVVTIVGEDGQNTLTFDEMAMLSGTINYEKVCLIGKRVPRIYRKNGKDVGVVDYVVRKQ